MKYERDSGLNEKGKEVLEYYKQYHYLKQNDSNSSILNAICYYVKDKLKFNLDLFDEVLDEQDLVIYLLSENTYSLSEKERIASSIDFAKNILDFDRIGISNATTNAKTHCLILSRRISFSLDDIKKNFPCSQPLEAKQKFLEVFVDGYMRNNLKTYLSTCHIDKFDIKLSNLGIKHENDIHVLTNYEPYFNMEFHIKIDDLDDEVLGEVGKILLNLPNLA